MATKLSIAIGGLLFVVGAGAASASEPKAFVFSCEGKVDGDYAHPTRCDYFVACVAQAHAYEMPCPLDRDGKRLHWVQTSGPDPVTSQCDHPAVAGCDLTPEEGKSKASDKDDKDDADAS